MKLYSVQFLRALAAILVVYTHCLTYQSRLVVSQQENFYHLKYFGCIGVDLFFVISGFIITLVAYKYSGKEQTIYFLVKRFSRINPIYYLASVLCFIYYFFRFLNTHKLSDIPSEEIINSIFDTILIIPTSQSIESHSPFLVVSWTLGFEWLFYILFCFLILIKIKRKAFFLASLIILLVTIGQITKPEDFRLIFITNPIMLDFLLGILICVIYQKRNQIPTALPVVCLLIGVTSYAFLVIYGYGNAWFYKDVLSAKESMSRFIKWGIPSGFLAGSCIFLEMRFKNIGLWKQQFIQLIGNSSYSIYLIHITYLEFYYKLCKYKNWILPADLNVILQFLISIALGITFYKYIEKPFLLRINKPNKVSSFDTLFTLTKTKAMV